MPSEEDNPSNLSLSGENMKEEKKVTFDFGQKTFVLPLKDFTTIAEVDYILSSAMRDANEKINELLDRQEKAALTKITGWSQEQDERFKKAEEEVKRLTDEVDKLEKARK